MGSVIVSIGVMLHLPMFLMAHTNGFVLAGMPMDPGMLAGMALIVGGISAADYGLLPNSTHNMKVDEAFGPPEDAPLTRAHWRLMVVLAVALIIDVMKPASLGFVTPGMRAEYGIDRTTVALLPLSALIGTAVGSFVWRAFADMRGRQCWRHRHVELQISDEHDRRVHLRGTSLASIVWQVWSNTLLPICQMRRECDGSITYGECQEGNVNDHFYQLAAF